MKKVAYDIHQVNMARARARTHTHTHIHTHYCKAMCINS